MIGAATRALALLLGPLALLSLEAAGHQQKEAVTRVLFNPRTGNIEVMHRFLIHDAEHAGRQLFGKAADLLGSPADCQRFEAYVNQQFVMTNQNGEPLALEPVGYELDGEHLWVYTETAIPENLSALTLSHNALRDIWPEQSNLVNIERDGRVRSALFTEGSREITIVFEDPGTS